MTASDPTVDAVAATLRGYRFSYASEADLQSAIADVLTDAFPHTTVTREVRLPAGLGRVDVLIGRVVVEVKVAGTGDSLGRQVRRYASSDQVDGVVIVTNRVRHARVPEAVGGKPVVVVGLAGHL